MKGAKPSRLYDVDTFKRKADEGVIVALRKEIITEVCKAEGSTDAAVKLDFVLSTSTPDRSKDSISQDGWKLENYRKNPVVLWAHNSAELPVGKAPNVVVEMGESGSRLVARGVEFTPEDMNPVGHAVGRMYAGGFLNAVSVGFLPIKYMRNEERGGWAVDFVEQELLEFSAVPVPANPEALIGAKAAGIPIDWIREWAEKVLDTREQDGFRPAAVEHVERLRAVVAPKTFQVPRAKDDEPAPEGDAAEDDALLEQMASLEAALLANVEALTANTKAIEASQKAQTSAATKAGLKVAPPAFAAPPGVTADDIAKEIQKQLQQITGRLA